MFEVKERIEEYKQTGCYYISNEVYDLLWSDRIGEWRMSNSAQSMRSCIELDKVDRELDELGYDLVIGEFCLDPEKYKLDQIKHMSPLDLERLKAL